MPLRAFLVFAAAILSCGIFVGCDIDVHERADRPSVDVQVERPKPNVDVDVNVKPKPNVDIDVDVKPKPNP